ncbi:hypothetical protein BGW38_002676 [Lunasporangiospora selenospora]|uniref:Uncharacterized protein n=1 Tax=Lunasporangiospora selenospora TaxID=979761 RepID=A0A9P6FRQ8_9FUNG|nr:hypothetical protein BGW38_002676 [Lunasporangiospora selenospora]
MPIITFDRRAVSIKINLKDDDTPIILWEECKAKFLLVGQQFRNKQRNAERRKRGRVLHSLKEADRLLDTDLNGPEAAIQKMAAQEKLNLMEQIQLERLAILTKVKWLKEGERPSPFFTRRLKAGRACKLINLNQ